MLYNVRMDTNEFTILLLDEHVRFDSLQAQIKRITKLSFKSDLTVMLGNSSKLRELISKELVECRRLRKVTSQCQTLLTAYSHSLNTLEEHVTFGILLNS